MSVAFVYTERTVDAMLTVRDRPYHWPGDAAEEQVRICLGFSWDLPKSVGAETASES
jgi:hypothetical protein